MKMENGSNVYQVGKKVAEFRKYELFLCELEGIDRQHLLQIATAREHNGSLDRSVFVLKELETSADRLEREYEKIRTDSNVLLNYNLGFPEPVDSFVCQEQDGRWVNIIAFRNVKNVSDMVPLINITAKDKRRIDLRTSAWIMGKLLKVLFFAHSEKFSVGLVAGKNILIEPRQHYVMIFDWSAAQTHPEKVPEEIRRQEISQAAQAVIIALGGKLETGVFPDDVDAASSQYTDYLLWLALGNENNTKRAHTKFYKFVDLLWEREFYPFTTKKLS